MLIIFDLENTNISILSGLKIINYGRTGHTQRLHVLFPEWTSNLLFWLRFVLVMVVSLPSF